MYHILLSGVLFSLIYLITTREIKQSQPRMVDKGISSVQRGPRGESSSAMLVICDLEIYLTSQNFVLSPVKDINNINLNFYSPRFLVKFKLIYEDYKELSVGFCVWYACSKW